MPRITIAEGGVTPGQRSSVSFSGKGKMVYKYDADLACIKGTMTFHADLSELDGLIDSITESDARALFGFAGGIRPSNKGDALQLTSLFIFPSSEVIVGEEKKVRFDTPDLTVGQRKSDGSSNISPTPRRVGLSFLLLATILALVFICFSCYSEYHFGINHHAVQQWLAFTLDKSVKIISVVKKNVVNFVSNYDYNAQNGFLPESTREQIRFIADVINKMSASTIGGNRTQFIHKAAMKAQEKIQLKYTELVQMMMSGNGNLDVPNAVTD
jgi:hypothetical protein